MIPGIAPAMKRSLIETWAIDPYKMNIKLGLETSLEETTLTPLDFVEVIKYLLRLRRGEGITDDIDHLGNRRVRSVGELVENAFRIGLTRMERTIKEKMTRSDKKRQALERTSNPQVAGSNPARRTRTVKGLSIFA